MNVDYVTMGANDGADGANNGTNGVIGAYEGCNSNCRFTHSRHCELPLAARNEAESRINPMYSTLLDSASFLAAKGSLQ